MAGKGVKQRAKENRKVSKKRSKVLKNFGVPIGDEIVPLSTVSIKLNGIDNTLLTFQNLIKAFNNGEINRQDFNSFCYCLNTYTGILRLKLEEIWIEKLDKLEELKVKGFGYERNEPSEEII
jgi:hypothetical protein